LNGGGNTGYEFLAETDFIYSRALVTAAVLWPENVKKTEGHCHVMGSRDFNSASTGFYCSCNGPVCLSV